MIRLDRLLAATPADGDLSFDVHGFPRSWPPTPTETAVIYVDQVTDAAKTVNQGEIQGSLDRDQIWTVVGFKMKRDVVSSMSGEPMTPQDLIDAVSEAGIPWSAVSVSSS